MTKKRGESARERVGAAVRLLGAEGYERSRIQPFIARVHDAMLDALAGSPEPETVLDVGCGTGRLLRKVGLRWPGATLIGVDPTAAMISVARRAAPSASFCLASAESLPLASESIDLALSSISLHHWDDPGRGLRELARVLRPGGCLCLADVALPDWLARLVRSGARSPSAIRNLVSRADLALRTQRLILARVIVLAVAAKPVFPPAPAAMP